MEKLKGYEHFHIVFAVGAAFQFLWTVKKKIPTCVFSSYCHELNTPTILSDTCLDPPISVLFNVSAAFSCS